MVTKDWLACPWLLLSCVCCVRASLSSSCSKIFGVTLSNTSSCWKRFLFGLHLLGLDMKQMWIFSHIFLNWVGKSQKIKALLNEFPIQRVISLCNIQYNCAYTPYPVSLWHHMKDFFPLPSSISLAFCPCISAPCLSEILLAKIGWSWLTQIFILCCISRCII